MIKIQNLNKKNLFRNGYNINLEFGSKGFVVLFGNDQSGNKTLLNIIGGLEKFDGGDLLVNNTSIKSLTNEDLNYYRSNYIGFLYEDIDLFNNLTVSENLELILELRGISNEEIIKIVNEIIERFNLQDIKDSLPIKLSKREIQKVKIAGAIANDSKIILVDRKIDIEIMEILKEVSQEKLVIVASNNYDIKQYSDRMIYFGSGREIISDEIINEHNLGVKEVEESLDLNKRLLSLKNIFKYTKKWMIRNYIVTLFLILTVMLFGLATNYGQYDVGKVSAKTMYDNNISELVFKNRNNRCYPSGGGSISCSFSGLEVRSQNILADFDYYKETYKNNKYYKVRRRWQLLDIYDRDSTYYYQIGSSKTSVAIYDDIRQFESSLIYGDKITESTDVYITDYIANLLVETSDDITQMESLIGEEISLTTGIYRMDNKKDSKFIKFKIAGIIDTDYEHYDHLKNSEDVDIIIESEYVFDVQNKYGKIITSSENMKIVDNMIHEDAGIILHYCFLNNEDIYSISTYVTTYFNNNNNNNNDIVLLGDSKLPTSKDEVVIPLQFLIDIMISEGIDHPTEAQLITEQEKYLDEFINKKFNLKFDMYSKTFEKELTIVGMYMSDDEDYDYYSPLILSDELYKDIYYHDLGIDLGIELGDDEKENIALLQSLDENYRHYTPYSNTIYNLEHETNNTQETLYKIAFALVLIVVVMEIIRISSKAKNRKKLNRTLQSKGINPTKFFMMRGLMAWLITVVIAYLLLSVIMIVINLVVINKYNISYFLPYQSIFSILTVIVFSFIIYLGAALREI